MVELVPETVYAKTSQGSDEIATRRHGLSMRVRQLLILIDGRRSVADLGRMMPDTELRANLALLLDQGFVAVAVAGVPPPAVPIGAGADAPAAPPLQLAPQAPPPAQGHDLESVRRQLVRQLIDTIGPNADAMAVRIERCRSVDEIRQLLPTIASLVEAIRGRSMMAAFLDEVGPL
jgi:hypothetical protein